MTLKQLVESGMTPYAPEILPTDSQTDPGADPVETPDRGPNAKKERLHPRIGKRTVPRASWVAHWLRAQRQADDSGRSRNLGQLSAERAEFSTLPPGALYSKSYEHALKQWSVHRSTRNEIRTPLKAGPEAFGEPV